MSKRKPVLLAASVPSKRVTKSVPEPPVKNSEEDESEYSESEEEESPAPSVTCADKCRDSGALRAEKKGVDATTSIPSAQELQRERQEALDREKKDFTTELIHNFERNARAGSNSFVVCYDVRYKWQYVCLENLFKSKGYDITYKNIRDYEEDRTFAELRIPNSINAKEPFHV
jgi:hypothetical protein